MISQHNRLSKFKARFVLQCLLGKGSDGEVFRANVENGRDVAIKVLRCKHGALTGLEFYLQSLANHPNILKICDFVHTPWYSCAEIELVDKTMHQWLRRRGFDPPSLEVGKTWVGDVAAGLAHMHGINIIHRDIHTGNLFIVADPTKVIGMRLLIGDFSRAVQLAQEPIMLDAGGCVATRPPEQLFCAGPRYNEGKHIRPGKCPHGFSSDVWALGCICLLMATGQMPFSNGSNELDVANAVLHLLGPPPAELRLSIVGCRVPLIASWPPKWGCWRQDEQLKKVVRSILQYTPCMRPRARDVIAVVNPQ